MIITFQMWKIILGLIISAFLIAFAVNYIGNYTQQQNDILRAKTVNAFELACYNVYNTGNAMTFDDFSTVPFDIGFSTTEGAMKIAGLGSRDIKVPVAFSIGDDMIISRSEQDIGWWKFRYVVAMPQTEIVLTIGNSPDAIETVKGIVKALPDTTNFDNKVTYAFCNGNKITRGCGASKTCEGKAFLEYLEAGSVPRSSTCTADIKANQRLVTISMSCVSGLGLCIEPQGSSTGKAWIGGYEQPVAYGDYADLAVLLVGYDKKDAYGVLGIGMLSHKNAEMSKEIAIAAKIMAGRAAMLAGGLESLSGSGQIDSDAEEMECVKLFRELSELLSSASSAVAGGSDASGYMERAADKNKEIVEKGCDYE